MPLLFTNLCHFFQYLCLQCFIYIPEIVYYILLQLSSIRCSILYRNHCPLCDHLSLQLGHLSCHHYFTLTQDYLVFEEEGEGEEARHEKMETAVDDCHNIVDHVWSWMGHWPAGNTSPLHHSHQRHIFHSVHSLVCFPGFVHLHHALCTIY